MQIVSPDFVLF